MGRIVIARVRILPNGFSSQRSVLMPRSTVSLGPPKRPPPAGGSRDPLLARQVPETIDVALIREAAKQKSPLRPACSRIAQSSRRSAGPPGAGVKVQIWREASEATRLSELDVEPQLGRPQGIEVGGVPCARLQFRASIPHRRFVP
jgi:hypothetical protein